MICLFGFRYRWGLMVAASQMPDDHQTIRRWHISRDSNVLPQCEQVYSVIAVRCHSRDTENIDSETDLKESLGNQSFKDLIACMVGFWPCAVALCGHGFFLPCPASTRDLGGI